MSGFLLFLGVVLSIIVLRYLFSKLGWQKSGTHHHSGTYIPYSGESSHGHRGGDRGESDASHNAGGSEGSWGDSGSGGDGGGWGDSGSGGDGGGGDGGGGGGE